MARVSKDGDGTSCFETALKRLLSMRDYERALYISTTCPGLSATKFSREMPASSSAAPNAVAGASIASSVN